MDEFGHRWVDLLDNLFGDRLPQVCTRCLVRADRPAAEQPCDALLERPHVVPSPRNETTDDQGN
jgi:hypothetical protein